ncbi:SET domain-containing protein [Hortaea werneckii]|nr:SET domain-containing protein [Hortaea werneckii]
MIRSGKAAGWLQLPSEAVLPWAMLNDVDFKQVVPGYAVGKGGALLAKHNLPGDSEDGELMSVPHDLILSLERVLDHAKADKDFREVLEALGEFGRRNLMGHSTPRGAILAFLLVQAPISCPDLAERVGVHCPFTDYVKSLPLENLPTFWSQDELALLIGTTLAPAVSSKLRSLHREYDHLCESTSQARWYSLVGQHLDFDDWLQVDAMYRSRALDFPEIGHCMVPCIDLANHSAGESTIAVYEKDEHGNATLLLRDDKTVNEGDEVTITYGDEKGACEMLFSYGFLESERKSAETLFLSLSIPDEDPYKPAKLQTADCAPGFKLIDAGDGEIDWKGEFIWLLCVGADDGLRFELARTVDGEGEEMQSFFGDEELTGGTAQLYSLLGKSELWDVYRLRAVALLQQRVFEQMQLLYGTQEEAEGVEHGEDTDVRTPVFENIMRLRKLEFELMERAYEDFERQKLELAESEVVRRYLAKMNEDPATEGKESEDFS